MLKEGSLLYRLRRGVRTCSLREMIIAGGVLVVAMRVAMNFTEPHHFSSDAGDLVLKAVSTDFWGYSFIGIGGLELVMAVRFLNAKFQGTLVESTAWLDYPRAIRLLGLGGTCVGFGIVFLVWGARQFNALP